MTDGEALDEPVEPVELSRDESPARAGRLRVRRARVVLVAVVLLTSATTAAALATSGHDGARVGVRAPGLESIPVAGSTTSMAPSTSTQPAATTSASTAPATSTTEQTVPATDPFVTGVTTAAPVSTTTNAPDPTTSTTGLVCHNSTDPACGPFHYEPALTDAPATMTATSPGGDWGQPNNWDVIVYFRVNDPDSLLWELVGGDMRPWTDEPAGQSGEICADIDWGDGTYQGHDMGYGSCFAPGQCPDATAGKYGAWDPPPPDPSKDALTGATHVYLRPAQPTTYTVRVSVTLEPCGPRPTVVSTSMVVNVP